MAVGANLPAFSVPVMERDNGLNPNFFDQSFLALANSANLN
jgi:hypothetical protein